MNYGFIDLVSKVDIQTLDNAVNTASKKSPTVTILKGITLYRSEQKEFILNLEADSEMKLQQITDVLISKTLKQGLAERFMT